MELDLLLSVYVRILIPLMMAKVYFVVNVIIHAWLAMDMISLIVWLAIWLIEYLDFQNVNVQLDTMRWDNFNAKNVILLARIVMIRIQTIASLVQLIWIGLWWETLVYARVAHQITMVRKHCVRIVHIAVLIVLNLILANAQVVQNFHLEN